MARIVSSSVNQGGNFAVAAFRSTPQASSQFVGAVMPMFLFSNAADRDRWLFKTRHLL